MTSVISGSDTLVFHRQKAIEAHILKNILSNNKRCVGTEWEFFFIAPNGMPITRMDGQKAFMEFKNIFALLGYDATFIYENDGNNTTKTVGLKVEGLGAILTEAGHQFEFASCVSNNCNEVEEKNKAAFTATQEVAKRLNYNPVCKGYVPGYAEQAEGMDRSRSTQWTEYYAKRFGNDALRVRKTQNGTASTQVTLDSGAEKFHEFFQAALLIEPVLSLYYANSSRSHVGVEIYGHFIPSQVRPIIGAWQSKTPTEAITAIVDRLMEIEVPFLPDPEYPDTYKAVDFLHDRPPTVRELMNAGKLSEKALNNIGGFFYTRPALKNFSDGLIEIRGVDSQSTPAMVTELARRVTTLVYDDLARERLLNDYGQLSTSDIQALHDASTMADRDTALSIIISGKSVADLVADIIGRCPDQKANTPVWTAA